MTNTDLRKLLRFLDWANDATLTALTALPPEVLTRDVGISFRSISGTVKHLYDAEEIWLGRWLGTAYGGAKPTEVAALRTAWTALAAARRAWAAGLPEGAADRAFTYDHPRDGRHSALLSDLVLHVVTHAQMHRGQVVGMIRQAGIQPPETSYRAFLAQDASA